MHGPSPPADRHLTHRRRVGLHGHPPGRPRAPREATITAPRNPAPRPACPSLGRALAGILLLLLLEAVALATAPARHRPLLGGALLGAGTAACVVAAALAHGGRARRQPPAAGDWFSTEALEGFPMDAVRPLLHRPAAPSLNRLYTAWILARRGHDAQWLATHLELPAETATLLTSAALRR
ncbi:hypothetical protein ACFW1A_27725 [Kitasatospora sp. NPDC058965]|uniref:hypothetical protein n=1 Tax=Kitasatospora sp. NPDC058965 TaxID=3346682 RepID=UPI0036BB0054